MGFAPETTWTEAHNHVLSIRLRMLYLFCEYWFRATRKAIKRWIVSYMEDYHTPFLNPLPIMLALVPQSAINITNGCTGSTHWLLCWGESALPTTTDRPNLAGSFGGFLRSIRQCYGPRLLHVGKSLCDRHEISLREARLYIRRLRWSLNA